MKILFVHQNLPGQFKHLAPALASDPRNEVVFLTQPGKPDIPGVKKVEYRPHRKAADSTHRYLRLTEEGVINGQAVAKAAMALRDRSGFTPDVIVAHMGWGEALYLKTVYPRAKLLGYFEWYYRAFGSDVDFDPEHPPTLDDVCRIRTRNALHLMNLQAADWGVTPTNWQLKQHPREYQQRIEVIHDGVDTEKVAPNPEATFELPEGKVLSAGDEVITYVARNLEPYRGFPTFMRAAELILKRRPAAHLIVVGGDGVSYGRKCEGAKSYREYFTSRLDLDAERIHFLGKVPYSKYLRILQISGAHVYLTVPFVLSWSMLESMAAGCLVIGSKTPPVQEVIKHEKNGLLVDFFDHNTLAERVDEVFVDPNRLQHLRDAARRTILQRYDLQRCLKKQVQLIRRIAGDGRK